MGFPAGYTEVLLPKILLTTLSLLGVVRKLVLSLLHVIGLASLVEPGAPDQPEPGPNPSVSSAATLIREMLPTALYADVAGGPGPGPDESCAVCLYEFEGGDEVRCMRNCRHVFHQGCVDRWIDHDRKTCPLCRKPFVPEELQEDFNEKLWAASGIPDFYSEYSPITNFL